MFGTQNGTGTIGIDGSIFYFLGTFSDKNNNMMNIYL